MDHTQRQRSVGRDGRIAEKVRDARLEVHAEILVLLMSNLAVVYLVVWYVQTFVYGKLDHLLVRFD